jgi:hypothetical protein
MAENPSMRGEKIYECDLDIKGMTDYGEPGDGVIGHGAPARTALRHRRHLRQHAWPSLTTDAPSLRIVA